MLIMVQYIANAKQEFQEKSQWTFSFFALAWIGPILMTNLYTTRRTNDVVSCVITAHANPLALNAIVPVPTPQVNRQSLVIAHWPDGTSRDVAGNYSLIVNAWKRLEVHHSASTAVPNSTLTRQVGEICCLCGPSSSVNIKIFMEIIRCN